MDENLFMANGARFNDGPRFIFREGLGGSELSREVKMNDGAYQTILPYGALAERVRQLHIPAAPECLRGRVEELAEAFEHAAKHAHDRASERSHFANICAIDYGIGLSLPPGLPRETKWLLGEFADALADGFEVLEWGDPPDDKPGLRQFNSPPEPH